MRIRITIDTDNDAFHLDCDCYGEPLCEQCGGLGYVPDERETARILRQLADGIGRTIDLAVGEAHTLRDCNGNAVGRMEVE